MQTYEYVVAKFTPDFVKDEPVNIGVIVHEKDSLESFGKFIKNYSEIKKRNPNINIAALDKILEGYRGKHEIDSKDYLYRLTRDCTHSLHFRSVCGKKSFSPENAVEELFNEYISVDQESITA